MSTMTENVQFDKCSEGEDANYQTFEQTQSTPDLNQDDQDINISDKVKIYTTNDDNTDQWIESINSDVDD